MPRQTRNSNRRNTTSNLPCSSADHTPVNQENIREFNNRINTSEIQSSQNSNTNQLYYVISYQDQERMNNLINDGLNGVFQKKAFKIDGKMIKYSPFHQFFDSIIEFDQKPNDSISFKCIQCGRSYKAKLGESGNLKKHLTKYHKNLKNWINSYSIQINRTHKKWTLDENLTNLAKYFLSSTTALKEIQNPYLRKLLKFELPCEETYKANILPELFEILHSAIEEMLKEAKSVCLITDLWSNLTQQHLALGASMVFSDLVKKIRIIGMTPINGSSNAESIKEYIELIVNRYNFDKRKICGVSCDQGSALVRLFKQNENFMFDELISNYNNPNFIVNNNANIQNDSNENQLVSYSFDVVDRELQEIADEEINFFGDDETIINEAENEVEAASVDQNNSTNFVEERSSNNETNPETNTLSQAIDNDENLSDQNIDPINLLNIEIATNSVPRYSCSAHKINLAVRSSIESWTVFSKMLIKVSKFVSSIRRSNVNSINFIKKKCKLRCENGTRWSSSYLMLESIYKAYEKEAFTTENPCPISKETIISFLKILHPLYTFSILTQKTDWTIGDLIPGLIIILYGTLEVINETGEKKKLIEELNKSIKSKFEFELSSKIYLTAALLNTSKLELWYEEPYGEEFRAKAVESLAETVFNG